MFEDLDEIVIGVENHRLACFGFGQATAADVGQEFFASLSAMDFLDRPIERLSSDAPDMIRRIDDQAYTYEVHGTLAAGQLHACGIAIAIADEDDLPLPPDMDFLEGQRVKMILDRLDIELHR